MARYAKASLLPSGDYAVRLPVGPSDLRPAYPLAGQMRLNTTTGYIESYWNSAWNNIAKIGKSTITKDIFTGDGSTMSYTMSIPEISDTDVLVFVGNVFQEPGLVYGVSGNMITFNEAPPDTVDIVILHGYNSTDAS